MQQHGKKKFLINTTRFKLNSIETEFNKRKNSSLKIRELGTPVSNEAVERFSSKPSGVDFDVVIDKPSKQKSPCSSKTKNCPVNEVGQFVKYTDEQINTRKEIQYILTENTNNADSNPVEQNNEKCRKGTTLIFGDETISGLIEKKSNISQEQKVKIYTTMHSFTR